MNHEGPSSGAAAAHPLLAAPTQLQLSGWLAQPAAGAQWQWQWQWQPEGT